ncbi:hypothetical protein GCM10010168_51860 [Actinoplanes ianthinogenes]|uniref:Uncharacterized protein n=1 Tax=Actinoplanes ianthinogenes TaxID=122358 RepID=A0ABM7M3V4_9ACTN|nr:hypothetical protein Aiant_68940 [Actinoplanes ianthinogenes]GGR27262.1 hypothetical protein GCM10010168_51860 [Actinoplanes ianthinogenes]
MGPATAPRQKTDAPAEGPREVTDHPGITRGHTTADATDMPSTASRHYANTHATHTSAAGPTDTTGITHPGIANIRTTSIASACIPYAHTSSAATAVRTSSITQPGTANIRASPGGPHVQAGSAHTENCAGACSVRHAYVCAAADSARSRWVVIE